MRRISSVVIAAVVVNVFLAADSFALKGSDIDINGYIGFESGQMVKARYFGGTFDHLFLGSTVGNIAFAAVPNENLSVLLSMEARMWFNTFPPTMIRNQNAAYEGYSSVYLDEAKGVFSLLKTEALTIEAAAGYMRYKYNPDAQNLGEYLFRSGTYPAYIINNFDFPMARIAGGRLSFNYSAGALGAGLDLLALTEREMRPFHDLNLAAIANVSVLKALTLGGGIEAAHVWAVDSRLVTPATAEYLITDPNTSLVVDTVQYSFKGTKLMARGTLDPLFFMREGMAEVLGNSGKIYGEVAILGLKNYGNSGNGDIPWGYNKLADKMPKMFGFTLPGWKVFDVCAIEFEHYTNPYPDSYDEVIRFGIPKPSVRRSYPDSTVYFKDSWKWSIYVKKDFNKNFGAVFQVGRDHSRWECSGVLAENADYEAALVKPNQYAWRTKIEYKF